MGSRRYTTQLRCAEEGCVEGSFFESSSRRDQQESLAHYAKHPYRCYRHSAPNEVLSEANPATTKTLEVTEKFYKGYYGLQSLGVFWDGTNGLVSGPGFRAIAKDFPVGTRLVVTARIEIAEEQDNA